MAKPRVEACRCGDGPEGRCSYWYALPDGIQQDERGMRQLGQYEHDSWQEAYDAALIQARLAAVYGSMVG